MRSHRLEIALTVFAEEAAAALGELLAGGAEVPIEIVAQSSRRGQSPLYSYRPLTRNFVRDHAEVLGRLHTHAEVVAELAQFGGLERYLRGRALSELPTDGEGQARLALGFLLEDVFDEQTDFKLRRERLQRALELLDGATSSTSPSAMTLVATLRGVALSTPEVLIAPGLSIARPDTPNGLPEDVLGEEGGAQEQLLVIYSSEPGDGCGTVAEGRGVLRELLRTLRLFGDGRVSLGGVAWVRIGSGRWRPIALGSGGRPQGRLLITTAQEDALRAFWGHLSHSAPPGEALAWALERFEMGCEQPAQVQALSDYALALRMLLPDSGEQAPGAVHDALLARRVAVLCAATDDEATELTARMLQALALERAVCERGRFADVREEALARGLGEQLRLLLRDVISGRLDSELTALADAMLADGQADSQVAEPAAAPRAPTSITRVRTVRLKERSDSDATVVRPSARKARAAGSR